MAAGKIQSKKNEDGQIQVLVTLPPPPDIAEPVSSEAFETVKELANQQVDLAAGSASALIRVSQEQAMRAENQLLLARQDAGRYRHESQMAIGLVACILLTVILAIGWCTHAITTAQADARRASDNAVRAAEEARIAQTALTAERDKVDAATIARARTEGELAAYKTQMSGIVESSQKHPTSQPANLIERMTQAFIGN